MTIWLLKKYLMRLLQPSVKNEIRISDTVSIRGFKRCLGRFYSMEIKAEAKRRTN